jgi:hypothetical protein
VLVSLENFFFYYLFAVKFSVEGSSVVATAVDVVKGEIIAFD